MYHMCHLLMELLWTSIVRAAVSVDAARSQSWMLWSALIVMITFSATGLNSTYLSARKIRKTSTAGVHLSNTREWLISSKCLETELHAVVRFGSHGHVLGHWVELDVPISMPNKKVN